MSSVEKTLETEGGHTKKVTLGRSIIAGPETAARLGVPVGTVIELENISSEEIAISDEEYNRLKNSLSDASAAEGSES